MALARSRLCQLCVQGPFASLLPCASPSGCLVPARPYLGECGALRITPKFTTSSCSPILFWLPLPPAVSFVLEVTGVSWPRRLCCLYVEIHAKSNFPKLPTWWARGTVFSVGEGHSHRSCLGPLGRHCLPRARAPPLRARTPRPLPWPRSPVPLLNGHFPLRAVHARALSTLAVQPIRQP